MEPHLRLTVEDIRDGRVTLEAQSDATFSVIALTGWQEVPLASEEIRAAVEALLAGAEQDKDALSDLNIEADSSDTPAANLLCRPNDDG